VEPHPQVSPDGQFWWDGSAWQPMPTLSPDGTHWWDGRAWQPVPVDSDLALAEQAVPPERQSSWTMEDTGPYGTMTTAFAGPPMAYETPSTYGPMAAYGGYGPPAVDPALEWQGQAQMRNPRNIAGDVVLWAVILVGFAIAMYGGVLIVEFKATRSFPADEIYAGVSIGVSMILVGAVTCAACGFRLMGLSLWAPVRPIVMELGIFGSLWLLNLILTDIFLLASPPGTFPTFIPWSYGIMILYKTWRGKWLAAGALGFFWVITLLLQLPAHMG